MIQIIDDNACARGGGGDLVTIGIYFNGASMGQATYGHLNRNPNLYVGQSVSRWGTWLGNVANDIAYDPNCWTGPHTHVERSAGRSAGAEGPVGP